MALRTGRKTAYQLGLLCAFAHAAALADERMFVYGTPEGCLVQLAQPIKPDQSLRWDGACQAEFAQGEGTLTVLTAPSTVVSATRGKMDRGVQSGSWTGADGSPVAEGPVVPPGEVTAVAPMAPAVSFDASILFDLASAKLSPQAKAQLADIASQLNDGGAAKAALHIIGHADASGAPAANARLAQLRARAVRDVLVANKVDASRLTVSSRADQQLAVPDDPKAAENRRVTFELVPPSNP
jgi:outer membrane protein OmpA-like peptidoglycan-associated protein